MSTQRIKQAAIDAFDHIVATHPNRWPSWWGNAGQILGHDVCVDLAEQMMAHTREHYPDLTVGYVYTKDYQHTFYFVTNGTYRTRIAWVSDPWTGRNAAKGLEVTFDGYRRDQEIPDTTGDPPYTFQESFS